jgi:hypothetical protein
MTNITGVFCDVYIDVRDQNLYMERATNLELNLCRVEMRYCLDSLFFSKVSFQIAEFPVFILTHILSISLFRINLSPSNDLFLTH